MDALLVSRCNGLVRGGNDGVYSIWSLGFLRLTFPGMRFQLFSEPLTKFSRVLTKETALALVVGVIVAIGGSILPWVNTINESNKTKTRLSAKEIELEQCKEFQSSTVSELAKTGATLEMVRAENHRLRADAHRKDEMLSENARLLDQNRQLSNQVNSLALAGGQLHFDSGQVLSDLQTISNRLKNGMELVERDFQQMKSIVILIREFASEYEKPIDEFEPVRRAIEIQAGIEVPFPERPGFFRRHFFPSSKREYDENLQKYWRNIGGKEASLRHKATMEAAYGRAKASMAAVKARSQYRIDQLDTVLNSKHYSTEAISSILQDVVNAVMDHNSLTKADIKPPSNGDRVATGRSSLPVYPQPNGRFVPNR